MVLDLTSLRSATAQLEDARRYALGDLAAADPALFVHLRAGAIQAFEFTYELAFRTLKRVLVATEPSPASIDDISFNQVIRRAYDLGLVRGDLQQWQAFRRDRGTTSHAYDAAKAQAVFDSIPAFLAEVQFLITRLRADDGLAT